MGNLEKQVFPFINFFHGMFFAFWLVSGTSFDTEGWLTIFWNVNEDWIWRWIDTKLQINQIWSDLNLWFSLTWIFYDPTSFPLRFINYSKSGGNIIDRARIQLVNFLFPEVKKYSLLLLFPDILTKREKRYRATCYHF